MRAHLIGGGPGKAAAMSKLFHDALHGLPARPLVAYVGAASDDDASFLARMRKMLAGARVQMVHLAKKTDSLASARQLLEDADAVFLSGGDVDHGMRLLSERGAVPTLRAVAAGGKRIIGVSAGSILAGRAWVRFPDDDERRAERFACLDLVPYSFDAHAEEDDWAELKTFVRLSIGIDEPPMGYGLPAGGALVYETTPDAPPKMSAHGEPIVRIGLRDGHIGTLEPMHVVI